MHYAIQGVPKMTPVLFFKNFSNHWHFFNQILHTHIYSTLIHIDYFRHLISKYTEYDNIFIKLDRQI